jgi:hypothetical protein
LGRQGTERSSRAGLGFAAWSEAGPSTAKGAVLKLASRSLHSDNFYLELCLKESALIFP